MLCAIEFTETTRWLSTLRLPVISRLRPLQKQTPASRKFDPRVLSFKYSAVGPQPNSRLQFDRFNFSDESLVVVS
jgi:hypothetical protein